MLNPINKTIELISFAKTLQLASFLNTKRNSLHSDVSQVVLLREKVKLLIMRF